MNYNDKIDNRKGLKFWYCFKYVFCSFIKEMSYSFYQDILAVLQYLLGFVFGLFLIIISPVLIFIVAFNRWRATIKYYEELDKKKE